MPEGPPQRINRSVDSAQSCRKTQRGSVEQGVGIAGDELDQLGLAALPVFANRR
jgi:hypothetical protein